ncbi:molybdopterin synthase sulfur carrier subunit [Cohaesibacter sp. ES.047]|uniref:molybdopterin converting factor subunit 1 n=1 Tax=Cohaesibacter sp. ES.047 TaxID=1798205 RepID=UPI000BB9BB27|nr:molybdopterin converting factor subunit 1 [Cohaesibacter sp. ES.047]SNY91512.1 molybdopterin synthase sulfur carrier subunit [Cohaesibacter sp. ES.047]
MKLVYFAWIRERIGKEEETITLPDSVTKVRDLLVWQRQRGEEYEAAFEDLETVRVALDQFHAEPDDEIGQAEEIAFFPPMTGG